MLRASQERDWIAVPVRRNDGEEEQEGEAVEHTKGETRDLCLGEPTETGAWRARRSLHALCWHALHVLFLLRGCQCRRTSLNLRSTRALTSWGQMPQRLGLQAGRAFSARSCTASVA